MRYIILLIGFALLTVPSPAPAQYSRWGFISVGQADPDAATLEPHFALSGGFQARFGPPVGAYVGVRTITAYERFKADEEALLDSLGFSSGEVEGGSTTVTETGLELMAGYETGALGGYLWYGIHYYNEARNDATIRAGGGQFTTDFRSRSDLGPNYGAGVSWRVMGTASVYGEWFQGGGFDDRMLRMEGLRFGVVFRW